MVRYQDTDGAPIAWPLPAARMDVRRYQGGPLVARADTATGQIVMIDGEMSITLTAATSDVLPGNYVYNLMLYYPGRPDSAVSWLAGPLLFDANPTEFYV